MFTVVGAAQINISEQIQSNSSATLDENKLYFVDFWATWCGPCIPAKKYLGTLQKQFKEDFYVISISSESPELVKKYIAKRPTNLAVGIDYDNQTFTEYEIQSLPTGILFDAKGRVLWKGHPANLSVGDIKRHLARNTTRIAVKDFIQLKAYKKVTDEISDYEPAEDFELKVSDNFSSILEIKDQGDYTSYTGSLKSILAYLYKVNDQQIRLESTLDQKGYTLHIKKNSRKHNNLSKHVLKSLKLKMEEEVVNGEVVVFKSDGSKFWDTDQVNWGPDTPKYLIGDDHIEANNVSFEDISYRLSNLLELPIIIENTADATTLHDWQVHYRYYELMQADLNDNYGVKVVKENRQYPIYRIKKKASF